MSKGNGLYLFSNTNPLDPKHKLLPINYSLLYEFRFKYNCFLFQIQENGSWAEIIENLHGGYTSGMDSFFCVFYCGNVVLAFLLITC